MYNQHANVNIIINRAGNRRYRTSRTSVASITSSSTLVGNIRASTPIETRSGNRPPAALAARVIPATKIRLHPNLITKGSGIAAEPLYLDSSPVTLLFGSLSPTVAVGDVQRIFAKLLKIEHENTSAATLAELGKWLFDTTKP